MEKSPEQITEEVFALYQKFGNADYIGEPVSQIEHMSQSAQLAMEEGYDEEVVLAAFFHDIGHICVQASAEESMGGYGVKSHEKIGADFLRAKGFPENIATLVENHVKAKRYLTRKYPEYYVSLSEASKKTLAFQGGMMSEIEAKEFEESPLFRLSIKLRAWDEEAKEINMPLVDLSVLKRMCVHVLST